MDLLSSPRSSNNDITHANSHTHILGAAKSPVRFVQRNVKSGENPPAFLSAATIMEEFKQIERVIPTTSAAMVQAGSSTTGTLSRTRYCRPFTQISFNQGVIKMQRPFIQGVPLSEVIHTYGPLEEEVALNTARRVIRDIVALHENGIIVKNLKMENIIMISDVPKIVDFGFEFLFDDTKKSNKFASLLFSGPEGLEIQKPPSKELDIYHFGILLYMMLFGNFPWTVFNHMKISHQMMTNTIPIPNETEPNSEYNSYDSSILKIIRKCFEVNPTKRPTARQVYVMILKIMKAKNYFNIAESNANNHIDTSNSSAVSLMGKRVETLRNLPRLSPLQNPKFIAPKAPLLGLPAVSKIIQSSQSSNCRKLSTAIHGFEPQISGARSTVISATRAAAPKIHF